MIISIYITISILSVMFFLLGLFFLGVKNFEVCMTFLSLAFVMFIALAFSSMQLEQKYCENQVLNTTGFDSVIYNNTYINSTFNTTYFTADVIENNYYGENGTGVYVQYTDNPSNINDPNMNITVGGITAKGQINKTGLYGEGNVRMGNYMDSGGQWGTICFETDLTAIGGGNTIWCIDNGGNDLRFYDPVTGEVTLRIFNNSIRIGDASHPRNMKLYGNLNGTGNITMSNYYGGMYMHNDTGFSAIFNATYQKVYFDESHNDNGFTFSDSTLTLNDDGGMYQAIWKAEGVGTNNHMYHGYVFVNEVQKNNTIGHTVGTGNNQMKMNGLGFIRINAGDKITVRIADETSTSAGTQIDANINLVRVGN